MMLYTQDCVFCINNECIFNILCILQFLIYLKLNLLFLSRVGRINPGLYVKPWWALVL